MRLIWVIFHGKGSKKRKLLWNCAILDPLSVLWLELNKRVIEDKFEDLDQVQSESDSVIVGAKRLKTLLVCQSVYFIQ